MCIADDTKPNWDIHIIGEHLSAKQEGLALFINLHCGYPADTPQKQRLYRT
jgi:hypothetical protein